MEVIDIIYFKSAEHAALKSKGQVPFHALLAITFSHWGKPVHNMLKTLPGMWRFMKW